MKERDDTIEAMADAIAASVKYYKILEDARTGALDIALKYGGIDGGHHKTWVIDQMVRKLTGKRYEQWVQEAKAGEDGPNTYDWDVGIAP
jgi:hypothetical protein